MFSFGNKEAYIITLPQTANRLQGLAAELGRGSSGNRDQALCSVVRCPARYTLVLGLTVRRHNKGGATSLANEQLGLISELLAVVETLLVAIFHQTDQFLQSSY